MHKEGRILEIEVLGRSLRLQTRPGLPGWRGVEPASRLLIEAMEITPEQHVLELACGYGVCGLMAALLAEQGQVTLADDDVLAVECAQANLRRNAVTNATVQLTADYDDLPAGAYDVVLLHAPAYRGNALVRHLIDVAHRALRPGGRFYLAGSKSEGLATFQRQVEALFGPAEVVMRGGGQRVLLAVKEDRGRGREGEGEGGRTWSDVVEVEVTLRGHGFRFRSRPGVFAHGKVDAASRLLLEVAEIRPDDNILDLGCGYGLLGIVAARLAPQGHVVLLDRSLMAVELARDNARLNGIENAEVLAGDGIGPIRSRLFDLILCNPSFHAGRPADRVVGEQLIREGATALQPGGRFYVVCSEFLPYERVMGEALPQVTEVARHGGFKVLLGIEGHK